MTVQDFIVIYNETFKYIEGKYGKEQVKDLWATISKQWCTHLRDLVAKKGLEGMKEYWDGGEEEGTLSRENASYETRIEDGFFSAIMRECPSVGELKKRKREIYPDYCKHCIYLYGPVVNKYGFDMDWYIEYDAKTDLPTGKCRWRSYPKE